MPKQLPASREDRRESSSEKLVADESRSGSGVCASALDVETAVELGFRLEAGTQRRLLKRQMEDVEQN
ncbi:unnamed protein product [Amaranthus hypochondriacus]